MERVTDKNKYCDWCDFDEENCKIRRNCFENKMYEKLKEYEDLEEQGMLLRLPCKVGDTVYCFDYPRSDIVVVVEEKIEKILIYEDDLTIETDGGYYLPPMFGKLIFTTREEAEAALEKMKGE